MSNVVEFVSFNLKKGVLVSDFLLEADKFNSEFLSSQKGYISRKLIVDGEMWADSVLWETEEDVIKAYEIADENAVAREYFSFMDGESVKVHFFSVERSY